MNGYFKKKSRLRLVSLLLALFVLAVNMLIASRYTGIVLWVFRDAPGQALSGNPQEWTPLVLATTFIVALTCLVMISANFVIFFSKRNARFVVLLSTFLLGSIELSESVALHLEYGTNFYDFDQYAYGPFLIAWSLIAFYLLKPSSGKDEDRDTHK